MEIKYTIKIKDKHNPPVFDSRLEKGVVATVVVNFKGADEKEYLHSPSFQMQVHDQAKKFLNDYFEVTFDKVVEEEYSPFEVRISYLISLWKSHSKAKDGVSKRLIEKLETMGIVAPAQGSKPRKVVR